MRNFCKKEKNPYNQRIKILMDTFTLILLAIFIAIIFGVFALLAILFLHIKKFREFAPYIFPIFHAFLLVILVISLFGAYKIITAPNVQFGDNPFDISTGTRKDF